jgi:hypothetical protein
MQHSTSAQGPTSCQHLLNCAADTCICAATLPTMQDARSLQANNQLLSWPELLLREGSPANCAAQCMCRRWCDVAAYWDTPIAQYDLSNSWS